jgi:transposase
MPKGKNLAGNICEIKNALKACSDKDEYRRIQCVYLAISNPDMSNSKIAEITMFSLRNVYLIFNRYRENGIEGLSDKRGGRYRENMSVDEEFQFLKRYEEKGKTGSLVVLSEVKRAYEDKVGHDVAKSTIYRLFDRHDFRKIVPYKRHRKANKEEQETFKKTL